MTTIEREAMMKTTVDVFGDGSVGISTFADCGEDDTYHRANQYIVLDAKQSKDLYKELKKHFDGEPASGEADGLLDHLYDDTTLPEEPEEAGSYITQNGLLLSKDDDGDWSYRKYPYAVNATWDDVYSAVWQNDWKIVVATLGAHAFPLKHITVSDMMSIAAQQPHDPTTVSNELETRLDALRAVIHEATAQMATQLAGNLTVKKINIEE